MSRIIPLVEAVDQVLKAAQTASLPALVIRLTQIDDAAAQLGPANQEVVTNLSRAVLTARMNHENSTFRPRSPQG